MMRSISRARLVFALVALASACGTPASDARRNASAPPESGAAPPAANGDGDTLLVGTLESDVIPDSALLSSWGVFPLERHVGIRLALVKGEHLLLADTLVGYDGPRALWRIRQVQRVEPAADGEAWVASCAIGPADASDGTVVARVTLSAGETLSPIHSAWRLDPVTWRFRPFPADSLSCYNEGGAP